MKQILVRVGLLCSVGLCLAVSAHAQNYPTKPVRIIVPSLGAGPDIFSRHLAPRLSEKWRQPVIVDNRPGASGTIAAELAARGPPDGHTLLMGEVVSLATAASLMKIKYDAVKDFAPITLVGTAPLVVIAHPSLPAANLRELIAYAKKHPGAINYASGNGSPGHLASILLGQLAGIDLVHVPYRGGGAAALAVVAGQVQIASINIAVVIDQIRTDKLKVYVVMANKRSAALPDVPTGTEAGLPGLESSNWWGLLAPARTPTAIIASLNRDVIEILRTPAVQSAAVSQGADAIPGTPEGFSVFLKGEIARWTAVVKRSGLRTEG